MTVSTPLDKGKGPMVNMMRSKLPMKEEQGNSNRFTDHAIIMGMDVAVLSLDNHAPIDDIEDIV